MYNVDVDNSSLGLCLHIIGSVLTKNIILFFSHLCQWSHLATNLLSPCVSVLGECLQLPTCLAHLLGISIQVTAPGVSRPPSLHFPLGVPCERLSCLIGCRLAKGVAYTTPTSLKDIFFFNWLLLCSSP
ncbi:hypothetical protein DPMN_055988 [Dreissena polymorpha]|uniref:Uncharacterized protein n=1 Tax=Dreissena polymorpha TaxID=45954 RepID=A0A9D4CQX3_DREPO|nr:hypothetical protein DPMN_055988 [Dreissena polymorpha]